MSKWDDFCVKVGKAANKAKEKANQTIDTASLKMNLQKLRSTAAEQYEELGRLTYRQLRDKNAPESLASDIAACLEKIDETNRQIRDAKKKIAENEEKKAAAKKKNDEDENIIVDDADENDNGIVFEDNSDSDTSDGENKTDADPENQ